MHEKELKSRKYSVVCFIVSVMIFLIGVAVMAIFFSAYHSLISLIALPFFFIPFAFCLYLSIILSAISLKLASVAVRDCMHDAPCRSSKTLKMITLATFCVFASVGLAVLIMVLI